MYCGAMDTRGLRSGWCILACCISAFASGSEQPGGNTNTGKVWYHGYTGGDDRRINLEAEIKMTVDLLQTLSSLVAIILSAGALYASLRKLPVENKNTAADTEDKEANTAAKYQQIARLAAEEALTLKERIDELEKTVEAQAKMIKAQDARIAALEDYNARLVHQLKSHEIEPVKPTAHFTLSKE
jgi:hypothetical protein